MKMGCWRQNLPNPVRGCLFIAERPTPRFPFVFQRPAVEITNVRRGGRAPLKNKRRFGRSRATNRQLLMEFEK
jgi:hypothetical protein